MDRIEKITCYISHTTVYNSFDTRNFKGIIMKLNIKAV